MACPGAHDGAQALLLGLQRGRIGIQAVAGLVGGRIAPRIAVFDGLRFVHRHRVIRAKSADGVRDRTTSHRPRQVPRP